MERNRCHSLGESLFTRQGSLSFLVSIIHDIRIFSICSFHYFIHYNTSFFETFPHVEVVHQQFPGKVDFPVTPRNLLYFLVGCQILYVELSLTFLNSS